MKKMRLQNGFSVHFKSGALLSLCIMPALTVCVGEQPVHLSGADQRLSHHESKSVSFPLISTVGDPRVSGSAIPTCRRSRSFGKFKSQHSSLHAFGITAAALAAAFIVLACFQKIKANTSGSEWSRNLDGGEKDDKLPGCPVSWLSCPAFQELLRNAL